MLSRTTFAVLSQIARNGHSSQRDLAARTGLSLGTINGALKSLKDDLLLDQKGAITAKGHTELSPYRVDNAIILAAGLSSRFAPISYEKPKGLLKVRGEVLVERQIEQLQEAGITDITIVTGYKQEQYFYLEDLFDVKIAVNEQYAERNNHSSLKVVEDRLGNTYICSSDNYFTDNPFSPYEWKAYYAAQFIEGPTEEWCMTAGAGKRIVDVQIGGQDAWYMMGHAYFDRAFSHRFVDILDAEYDLPETRDKLWEQLFIDHIDELDMMVKPYPTGMINEFDSLDELQRFDSSFLENVDSEIFANIETVLECSRSQIENVYPLKQGITKLSCHFSVDGNEYVYRHPGVGTDVLVDRTSEAAAQKIAQDLGLDDTFIFEDAQRGWKISRFVPDCEAPDVANEEHLRSMMELARRLHDSEQHIDATFDFYEKSRYYEGLLGRRSAIDIAGYENVAQKIDRLHAYVEQDDSLVCLSHNDFWPMNILLDKEGSMHLIDWEYAGMADYASDYGTFIVETQADDQTARQALAFYFGREPSPEELRHNFAFVAFAGWCWYVWSLYKESQGEMVGEWLHIYYRYGKDYVERALGMYERA